MIFREIFINTFLYRTAPVARAAERIKYWGEGGELKWEVEDHMSPRGNKHDIQTAIKDSELV